MTVKLPTAPDRTHNLDLVGSINVCAGGARKSGSGIRGGSEQNVAGVGANSEIVAPVIGTGGNGGVCQELAGDGSNCTD